ncbi:MAG: hypothetical protein HS115_06595 [Spirochaetales bacterium]|nr:hypothetical protein [Spirochaetales bacterium]
MALQSTRAQDSFARELYREKKFSFAALEYERLLRRPLSAGQKNHYAFYLAFAHLRDFNYSASEAALDTYSDPGFFPGRLLLLYSSLRDGRISRALDLRRQIEQGNFSVPEKESAALLSGTLFLEDNRFSDAMAYYERLSRESRDEWIVEKAQKLSSKVAEYSQKPQKKAWVAGLSSALLPGSGQIYANHEIDGLVAFGFNFLFIGSAALLYQMEKETGRPHTASIAVGSAALFFYTTNIAGAMASARRHNHYHARHFHSELRSELFDWDTLERLSHARPP